METDGHGHTAPLGQNPAGRAAAHAAGASDDRSVCMIVLNSVSHDARVLKEAATLAEAGFATTVLGITDAKESAPETLLDNGVTIQRVSFKAMYYQLVAQSMLIVIIATNLLWITLLAFTPGPIRNAIINVYATIVVPGIPIVALVALNWWLLKQYGKYTAARARSAAERTAAIAASSSLQSSPKIPSLGWAPYGRMFRSFLVLLLNPKKLTSTLGKLLHSPLELLDLRMRQIAWERCFLEVLQAIRPRFVHCHDAVTLPIGHAYKRQNACKLVYDSHELATEQNGISLVRRIVCDRIQRRCSPLVDAFVTVNDSIGKVLNRQYPALPPACVVMNATTVLPERVEYDGRLHEAAGLPREQRILLFQGGLSKGRGLVPLIHSAPLLPENWSIVVMGWGPLETHLRVLSDRVASDRVRFISGAPQSELTQWTAGASLGAILYENTCLNHWFCSPNKLWEYPNAGVPILASKFPEMEKLVGTHEHGWLLPDPVSPEHIAKLIASIDDDELGRRRENAFRFVAEDNWSVYADRLRRCYREMLGQAQHATAVERRDARAA